MEDLRKNEIYEAEIVGYSSDGSGVCRINGRAVFVPRTIAGEGDGGVHARDREDAEPGRVHDEHERVEHTLAAADGAPHEREKQHDRHTQRDEQIDRVLKRARRSQAHDKIAQDAAADGRCDAQQPHAEDVHMLFDAEHRAADGERDRPGQLKQKEKGFHRHDLRKKEYTSAMVQVCTLSFYLKDWPCGLASSVRNRLSRAPSAAGPFA